MLPHNIISHENIRAIRYRIEIEVSSNRNIYNKVVSIFSCDMIHLRTSKSEII